MKLKPFNEVVQSAREYAAAGAVVHQRFQCESCGDDTLGMTEPFIFYTHGHCGSCGYVTDLEKIGCNFLVILSS
jgi:hypothetical protein